MNPPLWKASTRAAHEDIDRLSTLFELTPEPAPQSVIVLTHPHEDDAVIEAYYDEAPDGAALSAILGQAVKVEALPDVDWVKLSQEGLPPVRAGRFFVYGAHDKGKAPANAIALAIDAGVAFGTGHHETTTGCLMALEWLAQTRFAPRNALDVRSSFNDTATKEQLRAFDRPVLVAYGDRSPEIVRAIGRGLLKLLPDARMEALAGANHGMLDSHPEAVARLIAS